MKIRCFKFSPHVNRNFRPETGVKTLDTNSMWRQAHINKVWVTKSIWNWWWLGIETFTTYRHTLWLSPCKTKYIFDLNSRRYWGSPFQIRYFYFAYTFWLIRQLWNSSIGPASRANLCRTFISCYHNSQLVLNCHRDYIVLNPSKLVLWHWWVTLLDVSVVFVNAEKCIFCKKSGVDRYLYFSGPS